MPRYHHQSKRSRTSRSAVLRNGIEFRTLEGYPRDDGEPISNGFMVRVADRRTPPLSISTVIQQPGQTRVAVETVVERSDDWHQRFRDTRDLNEAVPLPDVIAYIGELAEGGSAVAQEAYQCLETAMPDLFAES